MRVLVAEDDNTSRLIIEAALAQLGHESIAAKDGWEAWSLFQTASVDVVISDRSMPRMDGIELCRQVRSAPGTRYPYFIFLTSIDDKPRIHDGMAAGADDYLVKPLDLVELSLRLDVAARITNLYQQLAAQQSELASLNQKLFVQSRIDPLTGLGSRLKLVEDLENISALVQRYSEKYFSIMCDVDYFKKYNDTHGHIAGDEALRTIAATLAKGCRKGDQAYRFGGEEFVLILPQQSLESATISAERHRAAIEALKIRHAASPSDIVTISVGVAALAFTPGVSVEASLDSADVALYRAKANGRNRVTSALQTFAG